MSSKSIEKVTAIVTWSIITAMFKRTTFGMDWTFFIMRNPVRSRLDDSHYSTEFRSRFFKPLTTSLEEQNTDQ